jgi:hypothetical protein
MTFLPRSSSSNLEKRVEFIIQIIILILFLSLSFSFTGLTSKEVEKRLKRYGYNEIEPEKPRNVFCIVIDVMRQPMVYIFY